MQKKIYFSVFVILIIVGFLLYKLFLHPNSANTTINANNQNVELLLKLEKQNYGKPRKWSEAKVKLIRTVLLDELKIYRPAIIKTDKLGYLYVLDYTVPDIIKLSNKGIVLARYGKGMGSGPGELRNPTDFSIDSKGNVWVADPINNEVVVYNNNGNALNTFKPFKSPYRVMPFSDSGYVMISNFSSDLFHIYIGDKEQKSFGNIISDQVRNSIILDGTISSDSENNIFYSSNRGGLLLSYNIEGKLNFATTLINKVPILAETESKNGFMRITSKWTALNISTDNGKIYVLDVMGSKVLHCSIIDVYNAGYGHYINSIKLPASKIRYCDVHLHNIYAINDTTLYIYHLENLSSQH
jgi:6-bladed beta-propeller